MRLRMSRAKRTPGEGDEYGADKTQVETLRRRHRGSLPVLFTDSSRHHGGHSHAHPYSHRIHQSHHRFGEAHRRYGVPPPAGRRRTRRRWRRATPWTSPGPWESTAAPRRDRWTLRCSRDRGTTGPVCRKLLREAAVRIAEWRIPRRQVCKGLAMPRRGCSLGPCRRGGESL